MVRFLTFIATLICFIGLSQGVVTNGTNSNWTTPTAWTPTQNVTPGTAGNLTSQNINVRVGHNMTLNSDINIAGGVFTFGWNGTDATNTNVNDLAGVPYRKLLLIKTQGTHNATTGILDIRSGTTNNFEGGADISKTNLIVRDGAKLILGPRKCSVCDPTDPTYNQAVCQSSINDDCRVRRLFIYGDAQLTIETGAEVIVYGNVENKSNPGFISLNGTLNIIGNYTATTGNADIVQNVPGTGDITTTGSMTSTGNSTVFGSTVSCNSNCSGLAVACGEAISQWSISPNGTLAYCSTIGQGLGVSPAITIINNNATSVTYQWQTSTDEVNYTDVAGETNNSFTKTGTLGQPTYYRVNVKAFNGQTQICNSFSIPTLLLPQANKWIGGQTNNNWGRLENWCNGVPTTIEDVQIPTGSTPIILDGEVANTKNLILTGTGSLTPGANLTVQPNGVLNVYGNLTILQDTYTPAPTNTNSAKLFNNGEINFYGGVSANPAIITNLGGFVNGVGSHTNIYGNVQFADNIGNLYNFNEEFNHLIVKSGGRFKLVEDEDYDISGDIDVETGGEWVYANNTLHFHYSNNQYINAPNAGFYNLVVEKTGGNLSFNAPLNLFGRLSANSATNILTNDNLTIKSTGITTIEDGSIGPVVNGATISGNVKVERFVNGLGNKYRYISSPVQNFAVNEFANYWWVYASGGGRQDFWSWDEPINKWTPLYKGQNMQLGLGYAIWDWAGGNNKKVTFRGPIYTGSYTFPINKTVYGPEITPWRPETCACPGYFSGWNLLGNPYPSAIVVDGNPSNWTMTGIDSYIAIRLSNTEVVYWNWSDNTGDISNGIVSTGQSFWIRAGAEPFSITIHESAKLPDPELQFGQFWRKAESQQLVVGIRGEEGNDRIFLKINNTATGKSARKFDMANLSHHMKVDLLIKDYEDLTMKAYDNLPDKISLNANVNRSDEVEFYFSTESFPNEDLYLYDSKWGINTPIRTNQTYKTYVTPNETDRFFVVRNPIEGVVKGEIEIGYQNDEISLATNIKGNQFFLYNSSGELILQNTFDYSTKISTNGYTDGLYIVRVQSGDNYATKKILIN